MKNLRLSKAEFRQIEEGVQIDVLLGGFPAYCVKNEYGDFHTPSGVRFDVNFYALCNLTLTINGEDQSELGGDDSNSIRPTFIPICSKGRWHVPSPNARFATN